MTKKRTGVGHEIETALEEVLAHVRDEVALPGRIVDDPTADRIVALRKRMKLRTLTRITLPRAERTIP